MSYYYSWNGGLTQSITACRSAIQTALVSGMGWTIDYSSDTGTTGRDMYSTNGEDGNKVYQIVEFKWSTSGPGLTPWFYYYTALQDTCTEYLSASRRVYMSSTLTNDAYNGNYILAGTGGSIDGKSSIISDTVHVVGPPELNYVVITTDLGVQSGDTFDIVKGAGGCSYAPRNFSMNNAATNSLSFWGNKTFAMIVNKKSGGSAWSHCAFGYFTPLFPNILCKTLQDLPHAGYYTVECDNVTNFKANNYYQIVCEGVGREKILVTDVDASTNTLTISSGTVAKGVTYSDGSYIGVEPLIFGAGNFTGQTMPYTCPFFIDAAGDDPLADYTYNTVYINTHASNIFTGTYLDPDPRTGLYCLQPVLGYLAYDDYTGIQDSPPAIINENFFIFPSSTPNDEDTLEFNNIYSNDGVGATSGSETTVNDTNANWETNALASKVIICTSDPTGGEPLTNKEIRMITSNTDTSLTLDKTLGAGDFSGMSFHICDEAYRYYDANFALNYNMAMREGRV